MHRLPVQVAVEDDGDGLHTRGWVACPKTRRRVDLERCTGCRRCGGVLLEPGAGAPSVLCSFVASAPAQPTTRAHAETARAWAPRPALAVTPEVAAAEVAELMLEYRTDVLVVVTSHGEALGTASFLADVLTTIAAGTPRRCAREIMQPLSTVLRGDTPMTEASARMTAAGAHALPVADDDGRMVALLTREDVLRWALTPPGRALDSRGTFVAGWESAPRVALWIDGEPSDEPRAIRRPLGSSNFAGKPRGTSVAQAEPSMALKLSTILRVAVPLLFVALFGERLRVRDEHRSRLRRRRLPGRRDQRQRGGEPRDGVGSTRTSNTANRRTTSATTTPRARARSAAARTTPSGTRIAPTARASCRGRGACRRLGA